MKMRGMFKKFVARYDTVSNRIWAWHFHSQHSTLRQKCTWSSDSPKPVFHCRRILDLGPISSQPFTVQITSSSSANFHPFMNSFPSVLETNRNHWGPSMANTMGGRILCASSVSQHVLWQSESDITVMCMMQLIQQPHTSLLRMMVTITWTMIHQLTVYGWPFVAKLIMQTSGRKLPHA